MEEDKTTQLIADLKLYQEHMKTLDKSKFGKKEMEDFKKYYSKTYKNLVEVIKEKKDKSLSEAAKNIPVLREVMSKFNMYTAFLVTAFLAPFSLIVYLYVLGDYDYLVYGIIAADVILLFILVRQMQKYTMKVKQDLINGVPHIKKVIHILEQLVSAPKLQEKSE